MVRTERVAILMGGTEPNLILGGSDRDRRALNVGVGTRVDGYTARGHRLTTPKLFPPTSTYAVHKWIDRQTDRETDRKIYDIYVYAWKSVPMRMHTNIKSRQRLNVLLNTTPLPE